jgi:hypothetical protein
MQSKHGGIWHFFTLLVSVGRKGLPLKDEMGVWHWRLTQILGMVRD